MCSFSRERLRTVTLGAHGLHSRGVKRGGAALCLGAPHMDMYRLPCSPTALRRHAEKVD